MFLLSGLSSGLALQARGFTVDIWAKDLPPNTTSNKVSVLLVLVRCFLGFLNTTYTQAGAYWFPYNISPVARVERWSRDTYEYYERVLSRDPAACCQPIPFVDFHNHPDEKMFYEVPSPSHFPLSSYLLTSV